MDALALAQNVFGDKWLVANLGLIVANFLLGIAVALFTDSEHFALSEVGNWLRDRALPYLLGYAAVKVVSMTALADYHDLANVLVAGASVTITASLLGHVVDQLSKLGVPVPPLPWKAKDATT